MKNFAIICAGSSTAFTREKYMSQSSIHQKMSQKNKILDNYCGSSLRSCYLTVLRAVDARYDVRGSILAELIKSCLMNRSRVESSLKARSAGYVQPEALTYIEALAERLLFGPAGRFSPCEYRYQVEPSSLSNQKYEMNSHSHQRIVQSLIYGSHCVAAKRRS